MLILAPIILGYISVIAWTLRQMSRWPDRVPPPDPAFRPLSERTADDVQWEAVEAGWHRFLDSFPVLDEEPRT